MVELFSKAKRLIDAANNIALSTHEDPDFDGLGSLLAMSFVLCQNGKITSSFLIKPVANALKVLPHQKIVNTLNPEKIDLVIGLDYGSSERLEIIKAYPEIKATILTFDHHAVGSQIGTKIIDGNLSSTAEIIYNFINFLNQPIDSETATCLLAGIMDDTGGFRHPNTSAQTLKIAGELLLKGASFQRLSRAMNNLDNLDEKLTGLAGVFKKIRFITKTNFVFIIIDHNLFLASSTGLAEIDVVGILSATPTAKIAATLTEKTPGIFDVSLRSQPDRGVNVAKIAQNFGGGGHKLAAGFRSDDQPEKIIGKIERLLPAAAELND